MGTTLQQDWLVGSRKQALKYVLKWEIQSLLQRLAEIGEETFLLTADLEDGNAGHMGSDKGQGFLLLSGLRDVKTKFLSFCSECRKSAEEPYLDLVTGAVTTPQHNDRVNFCNTRRTRASNSRRKKGQKRSYAEVDSCDADSHREVEENEQDEIVEARDLRPSEPQKYTLGPLSKRKRIRKKLKADCDPYSSLDENHLTEDLAHDMTGYHSGGNEITVNQSDPETNAENQSSDSEQSDNQSNDGSDNNFEISSEIKKKKNRQKKTNSTESSKTNNNKSKFPKVNFRNKPTLNQSGLILESDSGSGLNIELESPGSVESDELSKMIQSANCRTVFTEEGGMRIIPEAEIKTEVGDVTSEELDEMYIPRRGSQTFKKPFSDEVPMETALLDSSKLGVAKPGVGRYQCSICFLIVRDRHDLKRHLRTHTKEKPYHCEMCGRNFGRKWDLDNHMRRHMEETMKDETSPLTMVDLDELKLLSSLEKLHSSSEKFHSTSEKLHSSVEKSGSDDDNSHTKDTQCKDEKGATEIIAPHLLIKRECTKSDDEENC